MDTGRAALIFFYGVFWATMVATTARYRAFPTALILGGPSDEMARHWRRLAASFAFLNVAPVIVLILLYNYVVSEDSGWVSVASAATASLSVFGIVRLYHALICSKETWRWFYTEHRLECYELKSDDKSEASWWTHAVPGAVYLIFFPLLAYGIQHCTR